MLSLIGFSRFPITGIHMPSYEIKTKQMNYHDFSKVVAINTIARAFIFDLKKGQAVRFVFEE